MKLKDVHFPKELLDAIQDGSLVIFAGAGVSMGAPSNLPSFESLVSAVAKGSKFENKVHAPFDKALGDMERGQVEVKKLAKSVLGDPKSLPSDIHTHLLQIAGQSKGGVRVVTTNLDPHFSTAGRTLGLDIEEYYAPALPLGNDFNGIVYLHGSTLKPESRYVLTDGDFGKAYLVDGWATRFVKEMFYKYTVLFVGYSHDDPVMNYISRGMPLGAIGKRYVLAPNNNDGKWQSLGIDLIEYPLKDGPNNHIALGEGLEELVRYIKMGVLEHEKQIQEMVSGRPPIDQNEIDYLLERISDKDTIQFFVKYAKTPEWIDWVDKQGLLKELFSSVEVLGRTSQRLAHWLSDSFIQKYPFYLLALIESKNSFLHPELWTSIVFALNRNSDSSMNRKAFGIFVHLLLRRTHNTFNHDSLSYLLDDCSLPEDENALISLFLHLTRPMIKLERKIYVPDEEQDNPENIIDTELEIVGDLHWLVKCWDGNFRNKLGAYYERLFFAFKEHVEIAYTLRRPYLTGPEAFDPISYRRPAIERHGQNQHRGDFASLLDFFADVLEWIAINDRDLTQICISWIKSPKFLFKRFAVYVMSKSTFHKPEEKSIWLLEHNILFSYHEHHETFQLLAEIYPVLSEASRRSLVTEITKGPQTDDKDKREEWADYSTFQYLSWLNSVDANCGIVSTALGAMKQAHPDYKQGSHPDFHGWVGEAEWVKNESLFSVEELLTLDLGQNLELLMSWKPKDRFGQDRSGLLAAVEEAVVRDLSFGFNLGILLVNGKFWRSDLWEGIIRGWSKANLSEDSWNDVLEFIAKNKELHAYTRLLSDLLMSGMNKNEFHLPEGSFERAMDLAEALWAVGKGDEDEDKEPQDWVTAAINHSGGKLAEFWVHLLSRHQSTKEVPIFPDRIRKNLEVLLTEVSYRGKLAKTIIASQIFFIFFRDNAWVVEKILPLFDVDRSEDDAKLAWDGYLAWGKWSDEFLVHIRPLFQKMFKKLQILGEDEGRFFEYVAGISLYASVHPQEGGWLNELLLSSSPAAREKFSHQLQWMLGNMKPEARSLAWKKWIRDYWLNRENGKPLKFNNAEKIDMIELGTHLEQDFDDAVNLFVDSPAPVLDRSLIYSNLNRKKLGETHPKSTLKLLLHLIPAVGDEVWVCYDLEPLAQILVTQLNQDQTQRESLLQLCELLARRNCPKAAEIRAIIQ